MATLFSRSTAAFLSICFIFLSNPCEPAAKTRYITIGTGGMTGVYYPAGGAICQLLNQKKKEYGIRCTYESTGGSVFNVNSVMAGEMEFGLVQSDRQFQAFRGSADSEWSGRPQTHLRSVFSLHAEAVTLVAAEDSGIRQLADLKGKRVNIGNPGSGHRQNAIHALFAAGLDYREDLVTESVKAAEAPGLLQDDRLDAFFYTVGHPSGAIKEATAGRRKVRLIPITEVDSLLAEYPYYSRAVISISDYPGAVNETDVETFGVRATLVTADTVPEAAVHAVVKEVFDKLERFKTLHPAFSHLTKTGMLNGLSAPLHPGAARYYREAGLMEAGKE